MAEDWIKKMGKAALKTADAVLNANTSHAAENSRNPLFDKLMADYAEISADGRSATLKQPSLNQLIALAVAKIPELTKLELEKEQGLIATIEKGLLKVRVHFTLNHIVLHEHTVSGQIELLNNIQGEDWLSKILIKIMSIIFGDNTINRKLPKNIKKSGSFIDFEIDREELGILNTLFAVVKPETKIETQLANKQLIFRLDSNILENIELGSLASALLSKFSQ